MNTMELKWDQKSGCNWDLGGHRGEFDLEDGRKVFVRIDRDNCDWSPREWDNLGTMVCWHGRYTLGDEQPKCDPDEYLKWLACSLDDKLEDRIRYWEDGNGWRRLANTLDDPVSASNAKVKDMVATVLDRETVMLDLYLYDHSGITMNTSGFSCPWDSGQVGFIYATREEILENWGRERLTDKLRDKAIAVLKGEVETYDDYLTGNVWGYSIKVTGYKTCSRCGHISESEDYEDSCWGYYGDPKDYLLSEVNGYLKEYGVEVEL